MKVIEFYKPKEKSTKRSLIIIDGSIFLLERHASLYSVIQQPFSSIQYQIASSFHQIYDQISTYSHVEVARKVSLFSFLVPGTL